MKKITYVSGMFAALLMVFSVFAFAAPQEVYAKNGNAWGHYKNPGNSAFGRSHNPHYAYNYQYHYWWDGKSFDNFDEFVDYLRDWLDRQDDRDDDDDDTDEVDIDITTREATDIDDDTATLEGTIDFNDSDHATVWFEYGPDSDLKWRTTKVRLDEGEDDEEFARVLVGLEEDQKYSFRAVGQDEDGDKEYGSIKTFTTDDDGSNNNDEDPTVTTLSARNIDDDAATLRGSVDMNDFDNGTVFFVYGEDRTQVEDVEDDFDTYDDIDEDADDLQKVLIDSELDDTATYTRDITGLDADTKIYYAIGVEYEDEDGDEVIRLGSVNSFTTDK